MRYVLIILLFCTGNLPGQELWVKYDDIDSAGIVAAQLDSVLLNDSIVTEERNNKVLYYPNIITRHIYPVVVDSVKKESSIDLNIWYDLDTAKIYKFISRLKYTKP